MNAKQDKPSALIAVTSATGTAQLPRAPKDIISEGDTRPYNVYVQTDQVEKIWAIEALGPQLAPLLTSIEITLKILSDALVEFNDRPYLHHQRKITSIVDSLCCQFDLISYIDQESIPTTPVHTQLSQYSLFVQVCSKLCDQASQCKQFSHLENRICSAVANANQYLGINLGYGADTITATLDYDRYVQPRKVHQLHGFDRHQEHIEDAIFARVHQVCEGILKVFLELLDQGAQHLQAYEYPEAADKFITSQHALHTFEKTIVILSEMVAVDYAPLRMALRSASGAQSERAQARKTEVKRLYTLFSAQMKGSQLDAFMVYYRPADNVNEFLVLDAFKSLAQQVQASMATHARMIDATLGRTVIGTMGYPVATLGELAAQPLIPEITDALEQVTLMTALDYASYSGIVTQAHETLYNIESKYDIQFPTEPCDPQLMRSTLDRWFKALQNHDMKTWVECFATKCHIEDPIGTKPYLCRQELELIYKNFVKLFPVVHDIQYKVVFETHNRIDLQWTVTADSFFHNEFVTTHGQEEWHFNPQGEFVVVIAQWQPADTAKILVQRHLERLQSFTALT